MDDLIQDLMDNYYNHPKQYFANKYNKSINYIYSTASKLKITRSHVLRNQVENIILDYNNKMSIPNIAKKYKSTQDSIKKILQSNNIYIKNSSESHRIYKVNESYFEKINSHKKSYWLGFIYGDGNIYQNRLQIAVKQDDKTLLVDFLKDIDSSHLIYTDRNNVRICIRSKKIVNNLIDLGVFYKKSLNLIPPDENQLPKEFEKAFILGLFDADGCLSKGYKTKSGVSGQIFSITGTKPVLEWVKDRMPDCGFKINLEKRLDHEKTWDLVKSLSRQNIKIIRSWMYDDFEFGLKRKKERFYYG